MKKKFFLVLYSLVQIVSSIYSIIFFEKLGKAASKAMLDMVKFFPAEIKDMISEAYSVEVVTSSVLATSIVSLVIGIVLLWIFLKDKTADKKVLAIILAAVSVFLGINTYVLILGIIAIVLIARKDKNEAENKQENKKIGKLKALKVTGKDLIWVLVLVLFYSTQFFVPDYLNSNGLLIAYEFFFYLGTFALAIYIYNKRLKRDFSAFKKDFKSYAGFIVKWWGIMLGLSLGAAIIKIVLGSNAESANQAILNDAPLWYVGPLAIIWAPVVEEGIFRLGLRRYIKNDAFFIIISAVLFGLLHTFSVEKGLYNIVVQSLQYMAMGGVMAYTYTKTNNSFVNMGIHCVQNTFGIILMTLLSIF